MLDFYVLSLVVFRGEIIVNRVIVREETTTDVSN